MPSILDLHIASSWDTLRPTTHMRHTWERRQARRQEGDEGLEKRRGEVPVGGGEAASLPTVHENNDLLTMF